MGPALGTTVDEESVEVVSGTLAFASSSVNLAHHFDESVQERSKSFSKIYENVPKKG